MKEMMEELIKSPQVSVLINCYNGEKYLKETMESVYAQNNKDWEIVIWDNGSTDKTAEIAQSFDSKTRYYYAKERVPLYASRNNALKYAKGKYIAFLDQDDLWMPTKLDEQISLFERDSAVGLVYSDVILFNEKGRKKRFFEIVRPRKGYIFKDLLLSNYIMTPTVMFRRNVFDHFSYSFDPRMMMAGDTDAWLRISYYWKIDYVNKPLASYRVHRNSQTFSEGRKLLSYEIGMIIENLCRELAGVEKKFNKELKHLKRRQDVYSALIDWEGRQNKSARKKIIKYVWESHVHLVLFILMFLPYRYFFMPCYKLYNKNIMAT